MTKEREAEIREGVSSESDEIDWVDAAGDLLAEVDRLRGVIEELIAYGVEPHVEAGLRAALEGKA